MADDDSGGPVFTFLYSLAGVGMLVFPPIALLNNLLLEGRFGGAVVIGGSLVVALPVSLEFVFSERDPYLVGQYVGAFVVLFLITTVAQGVFTAVTGSGQPRPAVQFLLLFLAYLVAYVLYARGYTKRLVRRSEESATHE